eukprot:gene18591-33581_t
MPVQHGPCLICLAQRPDHRHLYRWYVVGGYGKVLCAAAKRLKLKGRINELDDGDIYGQAVPDMVRTKAEMAAREAARNEEPPPPGGAPDASDRCTFPEVAAARDRAMGKQGLNPNAREWLPPGQMRRRDDDDQDIDKDNYYEQGAEGS